MSETDGFDSRVWKHRKKYYQPPGRKSYYHDDRMQAIKEMDEFMAEYCEKHKLNFSTCNRYELAKQIGGSFWKEFADTLYGKRLNR